MNTPRGKVLVAYRMKEADPKLSNQAIGRAVGVFDTTVRNWLREPEKFDPYYDAVAVRRALAGDGEVFVNLTHFERKLVVALLARVDTDEAPVTNRFAPSDRERVRRYIERHRKARGDASRPKHHKIAPAKRGPEFDAKVWEMRRKGIDPILIAEHLGASESTIYRVLRRAA